MALPISSSFHARMYGRRWFHYFAPAHITQFTNGGLQDLFSRYGYQLESVTHTDFSANLEGHIISLCNVMGVRHNFAFNFLQRQIVTGAKETMFFVVIAFLVAAIMPLAFFLTVLEMAFKKIRLSDFLCSAPLKHSTEEMGQDRSMKIALIGAHGIPHGYLSAEQMALLLKTVRT